MDAAEQINSVILSWLERSEGTVAAIVDPAVPEVITKLVHVPENRGAHALPFRVPAVGVPATELPALVILGERDWYARQMSVELALSRDESAELLPEAPARICGWVFANQATHELSRSMGAACVIHGGRGGKELLRYYDPHVLECLHALLGRAWCASLVSGVRSWMYIDRSGGAKQIAADAADGDTSLPSGERVRQVFARCGEINRALDLLARNGWEYRVGSIVEADDACSRMDRLGLSGAADRLAFLMHSITLGVGFDQHPILRQALSGKDLPSFRYTEAVLALTAEQWKAVSIDMKR